jgi:hypothetical protein
LEFFFWNFYLEVFFEIFGGIFFWIFFHENAERSGATSELLVETLYNSRMVAQFIPKLLSRANHAMNHFVLTCFEFRAQLLKVLD